VRFIWWQFAHVRGGVALLLDSAVLNRYKYVVTRPPVPITMVVIGAFVTGLISVGIGETVVSMLRSSMKLPLRVAAATSVFVVTVTVLSAAVADIAISGIDAVRD